jgi:hypothetical protein
MYKHHLFVIFFLLALTALGQDFKVNRVELAQGKVNIYYDLVDSTARGYTINVYASRDNFIAPLQKVTGDAGLEVKAGKGKKIVWDAPAELGPDFDGKMGLEVRGRVYIPFVRFERFEEYKAIKRGKAYNISWTGGTPQNILHFDLYKGEKKVASFTDIANTGKYKLTLPTNVKPGSNYKFKITDTKNKDEVVYTGNFTVKRKVPLLLKVIPILGVGALAATLGGSGSKGAKEIVDPVNPN